MTSDRNVQLNTGEPPARQARKARKARQARKVTIVMAAAVVLGGLVVTTSWVAGAKRAAVGSEKSPAPVSSKGCKTDADCTLVPDDCCSCSEGGSQRAIPKKRKDTYESERTKRCAGTMCAQMMSQHPSCSQVALCRAGACTLGRPAAAPSP